MSEEQTVTDAAPPPTPLDAWSGLARLAEVPATAQVAPDPAPAPEPLPEPPSEPSTSEPGDLVAAVARLATELADERRRRAVADAARRDAEEKLHAARLGATRTDAELTAARSRVGELERDRDEVIRRAEELLSAVRERADQRLAAELDAVRRHWNELLAAERSRVEVLEREREVLTKRVEDAWLATAVLRRARPLRLPATQPETVADAEEEVLEALEEYEIDPAFAEESPGLADEINDLRQRLRTRVHHPLDIDAVEDGVDQLRQSRLAREKDKRRRK